MSNSETEKKEEEIYDSEKTEKQDKGETEEREEAEAEAEAEAEDDDEQEDSNNDEEGEAEAEAEAEADDEQEDSNNDEEAEGEADDDDDEEEDEEQEDEEEEDDDEEEDEEQEEQGEEEEDNEHLLKNCLMATIRIPIRIDKDGSFDMINHYGEIKIEEMSDIPIKSSDSLYTKLLAYIRENPEYLAKIMKDMELKGEDEQQEESVTEITPDLFNFSNMKIREKPLNISFRSKTIKSKNFTKKNYKSDD